MAETKVTNTAAKKPAAKPVAKATSEVKKPSTKATVKPAPKVTESTEIKKETVAPKSTKSKKQSISVKVSETSLPKEIFGIEINEQAVHDTVVSDRASKRQGTHKVKHRGEVAGGGKKP